MIGEDINGRRIIKRDGGKYYVECPLCLKISCGSKTNLKTRHCNCQREYGQRYSGLSYRNSKEKIEAIKNKYKNGVPSEIINEWILQKT